MIFTRRYRYRFGDIDEAGIAYYPKVFHYYHCAFEDWWSDGLDQSYDKVLNVEKFGLPAVHIETDFRAPIRFGDEPDIHLGILRLGNASVEFGYWMTVGEEKTPRNLARITTVAVDMNTMEKQPVPDKWRQAFGRFLLAEGEFPT